MLHAKFRGNRPAGSGEKYFFKDFSPYNNNYKHGGHLDHVTWTIYTNFEVPFPRRFHIKFGFDWPSGLRGEDLLKWWTDDGRTPVRWLYYKLTL